MRQGWRCLPRAVRMEVGMAGCLCWGSASWAVFESLPDIRETEGFYRYACIIRTRKGRYRINAGILFPRGSYHRTYLDAVQAVIQRWGEEP